MLGSVDKIMTARSPMSRPRAMSMVNHLWIGTAMWCIDVKHV